MIRRRDVLQTALAVAAAPWADAGVAASAPSGARAEPGSAKFDFAWLKGRARWLADRPYAPPRVDLPEALARLSYDRYQSIRFRTERAIWADAGLNFRLQFFHVGRGFMQPVRLYEIDGGVAQEIDYDPGMFDFGDSGIAPATMRGREGFAGFRIQFVTDWQDDVSAFLGASYFRAVGGDTRQYGLSARGLAIDTAVPGHVEEFPRFTAFWFERPPVGAGMLTLYALLDSPSVAGAVRFKIAPGATQIMDVDTAFYPRKPVAQLGIAPLTSMFFFGSNDRRDVHDWRPQVHDSDGLALWTGTGEWVWRPLVNPPQVQLNSYVDDQPRGFGLLQRDRRFADYQDDGVFYNRRPNLWVEPLGGPSGGWGRGAVQLVEIPTVDETFDNIVAFWNPAVPPVPGQELLYGYRLYWGTHPPFASASGTTIATRTGLGGIIGQQRRFFSWHFDVDFAGGELGALPAGSPVEAVVTTSRGEILNTTAHFVPEFKGYRALFDVKPDDRTDPIDLRLFLRIRGWPLTETWIYQWTPPTLPERHRILFGS